MLTGHAPSHAPACPVSRSAIRGRQALWHASRRRAIKAAAKTQTAKSKPSAVPIPSTAKEAVETGLQLFEQGKTEDALRLFSAVSGLQPKQEEIRAAEYNKACALVKLKDWQQAADAVIQAVNKHGQDLKTALQDPDLAPLRERREWLDALDVLEGGVTSKGIVKLRTEARAPFRLTRLIFTGGFTLSAVVGVVLLAPRLFTAIKGGVGAPQLSEELKNFSITAGAAAALGFIFQRDLRGQLRDGAAIEREEALGRLQIDLGKERVLPLASLRGRVRPVILAGTESYIRKAGEEATQYRSELRKRGVSILCLETKASDPGSALKSLKAEFGKGGPKGRGFGEQRTETAPKPTPGALLEADKRWKLEPHDRAEWEAWLQDQKQSAGVKGNNLYLQVQLNGQVRGSGEGVPPWAKFLDDIPELDSIRTRFTDGLGR